MNNEAEISSSVKPDGVGGKREGRAGFTIIMKRYTHTLKMIIEFIR